MTNTSWTPDMPLAPGFTAEEVVSRMEWINENSAMFGGEFDSYSEARLAAEARAATVSEVVALIIEQRALYGALGLQNATLVVLQNAITARFGRQGVESPRAESND